MSCTGVLLVGGASRRFGSPKALAGLEGASLAERLWAVLGAACDERVAVGKAVDRLPLPFDVVDDGTEVRAALAGVVAGLRVASHEVSVVVPVDVPLLEPATVQLLAARCRDAAATQTGPLPAAFHRRALPLLESRLARGELRLTGALAELHASTVEVDPAQLANVNAPEDLERLRAGQRR